MVVKNVLSWRWKTTHRAHGPDEVTDDIAQDLVSHRPARGNVLDLQRKAGVAPGDSITAVICTAVISGVTLKVY